MTMIDICCGLLGFAVLMALLTTRKRVCHLCNGKGKVMIGPKRWIRCGVCTGKGKL